MLLRSSISLLYRWSNGGSRNGSCFQANARFKPKQPVQTWPCDPGFLCFTSFLQHPDHLCLVPGGPLLHPHRTLHSQQTQKWLEKAGLCGPAAWARPTARQACFKLEERFVVFVRPPPVDSFASRKMADPRALAMCVDVRSLWGLSKQAVSRVCSRTLPNQALQLTPRHWTQGAPG